MSAKIPDAAKTSLQGAIPSYIVTCSRDGTPNIAFISQVWYVDESHVALSFQFFNKTIKNIRENPVAHITTTDPEHFGHWRIKARFLRSEAEGPIFEEMAAQLEVIASMTGMSDVFKLKASDIYEVLELSYMPVFEPYAE